MAFVLPRSPLTPRRSLVLGLAPGTKVVPAATLRTLRRAEEAVAVACEQADLITGQAQAGYEAERQRGYQEGREEARMEQAEQMIENVARNVEYFSKVETRMVDLVMQSVRKIMADFDDRERALITVRGVLAVVRNQKHMTLRLNPQQVDLVKARLGDMLTDYPGVGYLDVVGDPRLKDDACILESEVGTVEASIATQLAALEAGFLKVLGSRI